MNTVESFLRTGRWALWVTWKSLELVVGETEVGQFREMKDTAWDVLKLVVGGVKFGQTGLERLKDSMYVCVYTCMCVRN